MRMDWIILFIMAILAPHMTSAAIQATQTPAAIGSAEMEG